MCLRPFKRFGCFFVPGGSLVADVWIQKKRGADAFCSFPHLEAFALPEIIETNKCRAHANMYKSDDIVATTSRDVVAL